MAQHRAAVVSRFDDLDNLALTRAKLDSRSFWTDFGLRITVLQYYITAGAATWP
jgi:hypothetical protein